MEQRRRRSGIAVTMAALLALSGCSLFGGDEADPNVEQTEALVSDLAAAMSSGDLATVAWNDDAATVQASWDGIVAAVLADGSVTATVEPGAVTLAEGDDARSATATLDVSWDLAGHEWTYATTANLAKPEEGWLVEFDPSLIEPSLVEGEALALSEAPPARADVIGAGDVRLVTERPVARIGIDKARVEPAEAEASARALADLVDVDADGFVARVAGAGEQAFVEAITLRDADLGQDVLDGIDDIPGARGISATMPLAPTRTFARPLLGTVGPATAEIVEASGGTIGDGDVVGLSGLQQRYDESLRGRPGVVVEAVATEPTATGDADGTEDPAAEDAEPETRELFRAEPVDGTPLRLTLDEATQISAEEVLTEVDGAAALVALRPSDGHVLAAASSSPDGYSTATLGQYAPGSTFKTVTALALLRAGLTPESAMSCPATLTVDGREFKNYDDYPSSALGDVDLRTAIANSCNTALIGARESAPQDTLAAAAASLGLGVDQDLGFAAYLGAVPASADGTSHAAAMIGQGEVLASPLAMAAVAASVSAGRTVTPVLTPDAPATPAPPAVPLTEDEATQLRDLMGAVVTDGSAAFLADVPGEPVIAKTGTAEYGTGPDLDTHAWMIAAQGDLAVAVFVETGESGSATAGPLLEGFLRAVG